MNPGDVILTRSDTWISRAIRNFTSKPGEPALVSHAGIFLCSKHVLEALFSGVKTTRFPQDFVGSEFVIYSPTNINVCQRELLEAKAATFSARRYGYMKIVAQALDWATGTRFFTSKVFTWDRYPYCSFVVAESYKLIDKDFAVPTKSTTPDDILDFVVSHPDKYRLVEGTPALIEDIARVYSSDKDKGNCEEIGG